MTPLPRFQRAFSLAVKVLVGTYLLAIVGAIVAYKVAFIGALLDDPFFATYGIVVSAYLVSRFVLSLRQGLLRSAISPRAGPKTRHEFLRPSAGDCTHSAGLRGRASR